MPLNNPSLPANISGSVNPLSINIDQYAANNNLGFFSIGSIAAGNTELTVNTPALVNNGAFLTVRGAGPASALAAPPQLPVPAVTNPAANAYTYNVAWLDSNGGLSPFSPNLNIANGPPFNGAGDLVSFAMAGIGSASGAVALVLYRDSVPVSIVPVLDMGYGVNNFNFEDWGSVAKGNAQANVPNPGNPAGSAQQLLMQVASGAGTTVLIMSDPAVSSAVGQLVFADSIQAFNDAIAAIQFGITQGDMADVVTLLVPEGAHNLGSILSIPANVKLDCQGVLINRIPDPLQAAVYFSPGSRGGNVFVNASGGSGVQINNFLAPITDLSPNSIYMQNIENIVVFNIGTNVFNTSSSVSTQVNLQNFGVRTSHDPANAGFNRFLYRNPAFTEIRNIETNGGAVGLWMDSDYGTHIKSHISQGALIGSIIQGSTNCHVDFDLAIAPEITGHYLDALLNCDLNVLARSVYDPFYPVQFSSGDGIQIGFQGPVEQCRIKSNTSYTAGNSVNWQRMTSSDLDATDLSVFPVTGLVSTLVLAAFTGVAGDDNGARITGYSDAPTLLSGIANSAARIRIQSASFTANPAGVIHGNDFADFNAAAEAAPATGVVVQNLTNNWKYINFPVTLNPTATVNASIVALSDMATPPVTQASSITRLLGSLAGDIETVSFWVAPGGYYQLNYTNCVVNAGIALRF